MKADKPRNVLDGAIRAAIVVVVVAVCAALAWSLLQPLIVPLMIGAALVAIIRYALFGRRSPHDW